LFEIWLGLGFLGLLVISMFIYIIWETRVYDGKIRRAAEEDNRLIKDGVKTEDEVVDEIKSIIGPLITAVSPLAGITIAALFIIIGLRISGYIEFMGNDGTGMAKQWVLYSVLAIAGVASVCWLLIIEQLTQMKAPSINNERLFKFHKYNYDLWVIGMLLIILALYLFLMLANVYAAMVVGLAVAFTVGRYWRIHNEWYKNKRREEVKRNK